MKIGPPYQIAGRTYVPKDDRRYDATGLASWYGGAHRGRATANGERFDPQAISAAHTTLPLPSYVAVTALATGRTILVRVNDRGPFVAGRLIDLSQGAARLLGVERAGVTRVRVRRVNPSEADRAALRAGRPASGRGGAAYAVAAAMPASASVPVPIAANAAVTTAIEDAGVVTATPVAQMPPPLMAAPQPAASSVPATDPARPAASQPGVLGGAKAFFVQVAAVTDPDRADALASMLRPIGPAAAVVTGSAWRVRLGPYVSDADALSALARARRAGYQDARVVRESAP
jgi:rare lipoprotein A